MLKSQENHKKVIMLTVTRTKIPYVYFMASS